MSKGLYDFLSNINEAYNVGEFTLSLEGENILAVSGNKQISTPCDFDVIEFMEDNGTSARVCNHCGCPMQQGFTDCCDFYSCEDCFEDSMNEEFIDGWRVSDREEEGENGGYYDYLTTLGDWEDTGIFYTEWN